MSLAMCTAHSTLSPIKNSDPISLHLPTLPAEQRPEASTKRERRRRRPQPAATEYFLPVERRYMMDPDPNPEGADPIPSTACVDAKRLRCSAMPANLVSKVLNDNNASSWPAPVPPLDDENLLQEILLRLPPQPSSHPRASLVCTRWRNILSDPQFLGRFRKHHRIPPLLGFFSGHVHGTPIFTPVLDSPNCIPAARFSVPQCYSPYDGWRFMGCRHSLAVLFHLSRCRIVVWDPVTGQQHHVNFPLGIAVEEWKSHWHAAVLCADSVDGHMHGDCFSSPFKLVLIWVVESVQAFACLYESASGLWGDIVSTTTTDTICYVKPSVLVGNSLCWLLGRGNILAFDFERQSLCMIEKPTDTTDYEYDSIRILRTEDGGLVLAFLLELTIQLWERKSNCHGVFRWVLLPKIIQLQGLIPCIMQSNDKMVLITGYDEETHVIVLSTAIGVFMLQLDSMQIRDITKRDNMYHNTVYPYTNFYTAEMPHEDEEGLGSSKKKPSL